MIQDPFIRPSSKVRYRALTLSLALLACLLGFWMGGGSNSTSRISLKGMGLFTLASALFLFGTYGATCLLMPKVPKKRRTASAIVVLAIACCLSAAFFNARVSGEFLPIWVGLLGFGGGLLLATEVARRRKQILSKWVVWVLIALLAYLVGGGLYILSMELRGHGFH